MRDLLFGLSAGLARLYRTRARWFLYALAVVYVYAALVHVLNIFSLTGFSWPEVPLKWRALDVANLALDLLVVLGIAFKKAIGLYAFLLAATSQIALYSMFRSWVLDVPEDFRLAPEQVAYLDQLLLFHALCLAGFAILLLVNEQSRPGRGSA